MKTRRRRQSGAVLVFALLVLVVGATILGGVAQLAVTQSLAGQTEWDSAARRIRLENSRAMARQYIMSQMWRGYGQLPAATLDASVTGGVGGFVLTNVDPPLGYWLSLQQADVKRVNPFGLFERGGFQSAWASGSLSTGGAGVPWGFQVRTRSPVTAGFAFVNHRPAGNTWTPPRRINMQQADYATGFTNLPRMPVSSVTNTNAGDSTGFLGFLLLPKAEAPFGDVIMDPVANSVLPQKLTDTTASVTVDLNTYDYDTSDTPKFYEVPVKVDIIEAGETNYALDVTDLVLVNSAGSGTSFKTNAVQVVIPESNTNLGRLILSGNNTRAVYLYRRGTNSPPLSIRTTGGNRTFRIGMTLDGPAVLEISGALTVRGGFRTGSALTQATGDFALVAEDSPSWEYDAVADRMMWLEDQRAR